MSKAGTAGGGLAAKMAIPIIYALAALILIIFVFHKQSVISGNGQSPLYVNLMDSATYVRYGFDAGKLTEAPKSYDSSWKKYGDGEPRRIVSAGLEGLPKRAYLSPFGEKDEEFTILTVFELSAADMDYLTRNTTLMPGIFLAGIGDNWEVYLNGTLIRSEMYVDAEGRVVKGRFMRSVCFPVDRALFAEGENLLGYRIVGDPTSGDTGMYYASPYYIGDYATIVRGSRDPLLIVLSGIYFFAAIYQFTIYVGVRTEKYNLSYCALSLALGVYSIVRGPLGSLIFFDSHVMLRVEYFSAFLLAPAIGIFIEALRSRKISRLSRYYGLFCLLACVSQAIFPSPQYGSELIPYMNAIALVYVGYLFVRELALGFAADTSLGNIFIGLLVVLIFSIIDIADIIFFHNSIQISGYSFFIFTIGTAFSLSMKFSRVYGQLDAANEKLNQSNEKLEIAVRERTWELVEQNEVAKSASRAKSDFLARMSHEIRTPMNAVSGMSELILREDTPPAVHEYATGIKHASVNLLAIVNDILDFSKIESGKLEVTPGEYRLDSLLNDVITIIRVRLMDRPVAFTVNIDSKLPTILIGDETRVRQILLNLMGNAAKYTKEGRIDLEVSGAAGDCGGFVLTFKVSDTGVGIKQENMGQLFDDFVRFDSGKNKNVNGTGLGLAIARSLCRVMGGDIVVDSVYGEGSTFVASVRQEVKDATPLASVRDPEERRVLVYEQREVYARSLAATIENLGVSYTLAADGEALAAALADGGQKHDYVFAAFTLFSEARAALNRIEPRPALVLFTEYGQTVRNKRLRSVPMPAHCVSVANILNNAETSAEYAKTERAVTRFTAPSAHILVVDDIATNLKVLEGLLAPFEMKIDTCLSGVEALRMTRQIRYDFIFMDHMMPDMDGMETTAAIRAADAHYLSQVPIIALTANAVAGMREMFLENGFDDYLSKPIEVAKLNAIVDKWVPPEKREKAAHRERVAERAVMFEKEVLALFCRDAEARLEILSKVPDEDGLPLFTTQVHALKSASASIGEAELSEDAAFLEDAGRRGDTKAISERLASFREDLWAFVEHTREVLARERDAASEKSPLDMAELSRLKEALEAENIGETDAILDKIRANAYDAETDGQLSALSDYILMSEFAAARDIVRRLLEGDLK
ncbi:hypothetical protein FACS1894208_05620 [Clostridia bacterium]|nr:hypothetical protein FACS1894208_05620 [Clostridia bacterium]